MAVQYSVLVRNARLDVIETTIGASPVLTIRTGAPPANCAAANSGTVIATLTLPADWMAAAVAGVASKSGTWSVAAAANTGTPGHYRIYDSTGTTCHEQGTVTFTGSGGDMTVDAAGSITAGQSFTVSTYTKTAGNP